MGGATSVMPVIRDVFSQQAADNTQWADTINWTVCCDWLQIASSRINIVHAQYYANEGCASLAGLFASFIVVVRGAYVLRKMASHIRCRQIFTNHNYGIYFRAYLFWKCEL